MASPSRRLQTKPVITCLKSVLLTYTFVFWVSGIVLLAVGIWGRVSLAVYFSLLDEKATNVPFVLVGAGTVVVLLGTFGCFATCRGSTWMLKLYAMLLSLIFLIVLVAAIVGFVFRHEIKTNFESNLNLALEDYNVTADRHSEAVDTIQRTLHCCGVQNYSDWERTEYFSQRGIPRSCCKNQNDCSEEDLKDPNKAKLKVFVDGCFFLVTSTMESKMSVVAGISFGVACFQPWLIWKELLSKTTDFKKKQTEMDKSLRLLLAGIKFAPFLFLPARHCYQEGVLASLQCGWVPVLIGIILSCCLSRYITNNQYEMV